MTYDVGVAGQIFVGANIALILAYLTLPILVVPFLAFRTRTKLAWMTFFVGCVFSHSVMMWNTLYPNTVIHHEPVGWWVATFHVVQAAGSWLAIWWARSDLERANVFLDALLGRGEAAVGRRSGEGRDAAPG